jgi:hypothetical protein
MFFKNTCTFSFYPNRIIISAPDHTEFIPFTVFLLDRASQAKVLAPYHKKKVKVTFSSELEEAYHKNVFSEVALRDIFLSHGVTLSHFMMGQKNLFFTRPFSSFSSQMIFVCLLWMTLLILWGYLHFRGQMIHRLAEADDAMRQSYEQKTHLSLKKESDKVKKHNQKLVGLFETLRTFPITFSSLSVQQDTFLIEGILEKSNRAALENRLDSLGSLYDLDGTSCFRYLSDFQVTWSLRSRYVTP